MRPSEQAQSGKTSTTELLRLTTPAARERGELIHRWFREIRFLAKDQASEGVPARSRLRDIGGQFRRAISAEEIDRMIEGFLRSLQAPAVRALFERPALRSRERLDLWQERPYLYRTPTTLQRGVFDRVLVLYRDGVCQGAELVELKSDRINEHQAAETVERYRPQLDAYREALSGLLGVLPTAIRPRLALVSIGRVVDL